MKRRTISVVLGVAVAIALADNSASKVRIHVAGCEPGDDVVLEIDKLEPARFSIGEW